MIIQGTPYVATYNNSDGAFYLQGLYGNPYNIPLAAGLDYWGTSTPNSSFAFPTGQAISRTTYSALFSLIGTTYGGGDGSTTFNLPDKTGRVSAMIEAAQTRLPSTFFGGTSTQMGAVGGSQSKTLVTANLPPYTPSGSVSTTLNMGGSFTMLPGGTPFGFGGANSGGEVFTPTASSTFTGTAQGGTSAPFATIQPTIICNYIIRII